MIKKFRQYKLTIFYFILLLIAIGMPGNDVPSVGIPHIDKVVHFTMFAGLAACYYWEHSKWQLQGRQALKSSIWLIGVGAMTEVLQYFIPKRSCDFKDLLADAIGIIVFSIILVIKTSSKHR